MPVPIDFGMLTAAAHGTLQQHQRQQPPPAARAPRAAQPDATPAGVAHGRDPRPQPGLEQRHLIFEVRDGDVVALVTDAHGEVVRTVPPDELGVVRREQARSSLFVDVLA